LHVDFQQIARSEIGQIVEAPRFHLRGLDDRQRQVMEQLEEPVVGPEKRRGQRIGADVKIARGAIADEIGQVAVIGRRAFVALGAGIGARLESRDVHRRIAQQRMIGIAFLAHRRRTDIDDMQRNFASQNIGKPGHQPQTSASGG
jgi:hypothetical protein